MAEDLRSLRDAIDDIDTEIAALLRKRRDLVRRASELKALSGEGAVSHEREREVLRHGLELERRFDLPKRLMRDIQLRVLRHSYAERSGSGYGRAKGSEKIRSVVIVGGAGAMGRLFGGFLKDAGFRVTAADVDDFRLCPAGGVAGCVAESRAGIALKNADWCIVSVPIRVTCDVIGEVAPLLRKDCVLSDLTSVKSEAMECMLRSHAGPVLGLHPMFGPDTGSLVRQVVVAVAGRGGEECRWIREQLSLLGATVVECAAEQHDGAMRIIQALRHFTTFAYGVFLRGESDGGFLRRLVELSSPVYRLEIMMVGRLFAQDPVLYCDIISASRENLDLIRRYIDCAHECLRTLERRDKDGFVREFKKTEEFFGEYAAEFLKESADILAKANDASFAVIDKER